MSVYYATNVASFLGFPMHCPAFAMCKNVGGRPGHEATSVAYYTIAQRATISHIWIWWQFRALNTHPCLDYRIAGNFRNPWPKHKEKKKDEIQTAKIWTRELLNSWKFSHVFLCASLARSDNGTVELFQSSRGHFTLSPGHLLSFIILAMKRGVVNSLC